MNIVTGYTGVPHVTSNAIQAFNQGIIGPDNYVLNVGNKFAATLVDANTVSIQDGEGVMQGVHFRIEPGETEDVNISNGTSGYKRIDLICARYTKNAITGIEDVSLVVIEGTPDASTPSAPAYNTGTILTGASVVDCPLYQVELDDFTPTLSTLQVGSIGMMYNLPFYIPNTTANKTKLYIIPSIKLMILDVYYTLEANASISGHVGQQLPLIYGYTTLTQHKTGAVLVAETSGGNFSTAYATLSYTNSSSYADTQNYFDLYCTSNANQQVIHGQIVAPYIRLNSNYPMSDAVPVT